MGTSRSARHEILQARIEVDRTTHDLVELIKKRDDAARKIAHAKKSLGMHIIDREREEFVLRQARKIASRRKVDPGLVNRILRILILHSRKLQRKI